ncbi:MAG TPA: hypothetical protein PLZ51_22685, partial [Aggregatilineales bacterium]|nr:hypothetical protein [Aggregatilineales bacterium]
ANITNNGNAVTDEGVKFTTLTGTATITNAVVTGNAHNNMFIDNASGTLNNLTITGSTFATNSAANGNHGVLIDMSGTSVLTAGTITNSTFSSNRSIGLQVVAGDTATISMFTVSNSTFNTTTAQVQQISMDLAKSEVS